MKKDKTTQLNIENVTKRFKGPKGEIVAVKDLSLTLSAGEMTSVHGPSGCGKTTLLLMAGGLLKPNSGTIRVAGKDIYSLRREQRNLIRAKNIGFVFQQFHLIPYLTVLQNVMLPSVALPHPDPQSRARTLISQFGLDHRAAHHPAQLSTGERQRTALARALFHKPGLILADEPTGNLDEENARSVLEHLKLFTKDGGAVLLVTHDNRALEYADTKIMWDTKQNT